MTANTRNLIGFLMVIRKRNALSHLLVAIAAGFFCDPAASFGHLDRFVKIIGGEIIRMPKAVSGLGHIFSDGVMWCMAIVAGGNGLMAGFLPAIVLLIHDMAIRTAGGIIAQIRIALGIPEGIYTSSNRYANGNTDDNKFEYLRIHSSLRPLTQKSVPV